MGYAIATGKCLCCPNTFTYNPMKVPSHKDNKGIKQPICFHCMSKINALRKERGVPPHTIHAEAYTACKEGELAI